jgi:hypothetical protein
MESSWHPRGLAVLIQETARRYGVDRGLTLITITVVTEEGQIHVQSIGGSEEHPTIRLMDMDDNLHMIHERRILRITFGPPPEPPHGKPPIGFIIAAQDEEQPANQHS